MHTNKLNVLDEILKRMEKNSFDTISKSKSINNDILIIHSYSLPLELTK